MEEADAAAEPLLEVRHEPVEARVLREDERLVALRHLLEQLQQPLQLSRAAVERLSRRDQHLGVVAHLLQVAEHREHGAAAAETVAVRLDPRQPVVDRRAVEARLLDGQPAVVLVDRDRRQLQLDLGRVLRAAEDERLHDRAQPLQRAVVAVRLDRPRERPLEPLPRAEQAGVDDVHQRPQLAEAVLDRRAGHRQPSPCGQPAERARPLRVRVLDVLRLVEQQAVPGDRGEEVDVAGGDVVRGDDDVRFQRGFRECGARKPEAAVVAVHAQRGREPRDLRAPLLDDAHRADDERRAEHARPHFLALGGEHRDRLDGLPEAHVVGQDPADPEIAEHPQPAVAALLEREERELHRGGRRQRPEAVIAVLEQIRERCVEGDLSELEPCLLRLEPRHRADELDDPGAGAALLQEAQRLLDVGPPQRVPAARDADEGLLRRGEVGELLFAEDDVADGELPVERRERGCREEAARTGREAAAGRGQVDAELARRSQPRARQQHRDAALLQQRHRLTEEQLHLVAVELGLRGLRLVEADAVLGEQRLDLGQLPGQVAVRVARAQEREDLVALLVQQPGGQPEGRIVLGVQPHLEHQGRPALVQVQAELPRSRGAAAEAVVEPAGEAAVERRVARVARQLRVG